MFWIVDYVGYKSEGCIVVDYKVEWERFLKRGWSECRFLGVKSEEWEYGEIIYECSFMVFIYLKEK